MSDFKAGDRVKVEFEGVVRTSESYGSRVLVSDSATGTWVLSESLTKIAPPLPTKVGSVVDVQNTGCTRWVLTRQGWHHVRDSAETHYSAEEFEQWMRNVSAGDWSVALEG